MCPTVGIRAHLLGGPSLVSPPSLQATVVLRSQTCDAVDEPRSGIIAGGLIVPPLVLPHDVGGARWRVRGSPPSCAPGSVLTGKAEYLLGSLVRAAERIGSTQIK